MYLSNCPKNTGAKLVWLVVVVRVLLHLLEDLRHDDGVQPDLALLCHRGLLRSCRLPNSKDDGCRSDVL